MRSITLFLIASLISLSAFSQSMNQGMANFIGEYSAWAAEIENKAKINGTLLNVSELALAKEIGVKAPEKVRVVLVDSIPFPYENESLKKVGEDLKLIGPDIVNQAQVFGHSIYVIKAYKLTKARLAHELVHVMQFEKEGSFQKILTRYLTEVATHGYRNSPLEVEAYKANEKYK